MKLGNIQHDVISFYHFPFCRNRSKTRCVRLEGSEELRQRLERATSMRWSRGWRWT